ncbi:MAG: hypothetical protein QXT64_01970 [Desulfurococcaceae archaeon]
MFDKFLQYAKNITILKLKSDDFSTTYVIYYLNEKIGIIEIRNDYAIFIDKLIKLLETLR